VELSTLKTFFEIFESALTGSAIIVGGIWTYKMFVKKREKYPRAATSHTIIEKNLTSAKKLVHLSIEIENIGSVLLSLVYYNIQVCQVIPVKDELKNKIENNNAPLRKKDNDIRWPHLFKEKKELPEKHYELEPLEKETFHFDLVLDKSIKTIQVYSYFKNKVKPNRNIGWDCTTFHDLK